MLSLLQSGPLLSPADESHSTICSFLQSFFFLLPSSETPRLVEFFVTPDSNSGSFDNSRVRINIVLAQLAFVERGLTITFSKQSQHELQYSPHYNIVRGQVS